MVLHAVYVYNTSSGVPYAWKSYNNVKFKGELAGPFFKALSDFSKELMKEPMPHLLGKDRKTVFVYDFRNLDYQEFDISQPFEPTYSKKADVDLGFAGVFDADDDMAHCKAFGRQVLSALYQSCPRELVTDSGECLCDTFIPQLDALKAELDVSLKKENDINAKLRNAKALQDQMLHDIGGLQLFGDNKK